LVEPADEVEQELSAPGLLANDPALLAKLDPVGIGAELDRPPQGVSGISCGGGGLKIRPPWPL
ncbi:hypothetical protein, partial [Xanthobacter autotrophicus]|uniref:hypothetical protein n=1 Tax=Xanthobacter autotrophicus TaxID=280 RepID=UPI0024A6CE80